MNITVKTKSGLEINIDSKESGIEAKTIYIEKKETWVAEALGSVWEEKGLSIPAAMKGKKIAIVVLPQYWQALLQERKEQYKREAEKKEAEIQEAMKAEIIGFYYTVGCDAADQIDFVYVGTVSSEINYERFRRHEKLAQRVAKMVGKTFPQNLESTGMTYGGWKLGTEVQPLVEQARQELESEAQARKEKLQQETREREKAIQEKTSEAKVTGKNVYLSTVDGYDGDAWHPGKELGWVNVVEMVTPEGKVITQDCPSY